MKNEKIKEEVLLVFISERDHHFLSGCSNINNNIETGLGLGGEETQYNPQDI